MKHLCSLLLAALATGAAWAQSAPSIYEGSKPATCTANTLYAGKQEIHCAQLTDGSYALYDPTRNFYTVNATYSALIPNGMSLEEQINRNGAFYTDKNAWYNRYFMSSAPIVNAGTTWNLPECSMQIDSIDIEIHASEYASGLLENATAHLEITEGDGAPYNTAEFPCTVSNEKIIVRLPHPITAKTGTVRLVLKNFEGEHLSDAAVYVMSPNYREVRGGAELSYLNGYVGFHTYGNVSGLQPALDAHWGLDKTLEYYSQKFKRNGYDGKGSPVVNLINPQCGIPQTSMAILNPNSDKAFINIGLGCEMMMGDTPEEGVVRLKPLVALQVLGHEFTHLVNHNFTENLECMGLAESFADIMGLNVCKYVTGETIWYFGGDYMPAERPIMRRFDTPATMNMAECYGDQFFNEAEDPYTKSTVQTHMYYLLVEGGQGVNTLGESYAVTPMSRDDAEALAYEVLTSHDFFDVTFPICRNYWVDAARNKWGENSPQLASVKQAWAAVGLGKEPTAITDVKANEAIDGAIYNVLGQRVANPQHGIFIQNGKKIIK
ncbi:MAG: M4 family metallopeptidase [Bacteroidales bacterium]|nr:M4 family metallopeptidase [Bacteroidales bacterium]